MTDRFHAGAIKLALSNAFEPRENGELVALTPALARNLAQLFAQTLKLPVPYGTKDIEEHLLAWMRSDVGVHQFDERHKAVGINHIAEDLNVLSEKAAQCLKEMEANLRFIYAPSEADEDEVNGFWSNLDGWTSLEDATKFFDTEHLRLPMSAQDDAAFVDLAQAKAVTPSSIASFNPAYAVKSAADNVSRLREIDVYRVLDYAQDHQQLFQIQAYICTHRPGLREEVNQCVKEIIDERKWNTRPSHSSYTIVAARPTAN